MKKNNIKMALIETVNTKNTKKHIESITKKYEKIQELFFYIPDTSNGAKSINLEIMLNKYICNNLAYKFNGYITLRIFEESSIKTITLLHFRNFSSKNISKKYSDGEIASNRIVIDEVFTREISNNIWNFKINKFTKYIVAKRLAQLLLWNNEEFIVVSNDGEKVYKKKQKKINGLIPYVKKNQNIRIKYIKPRVNTI